MKLHMKRFALIASVFALAILVGACQDVAGIIRIESPECPVKRPTDSTATVPLGCLYDSAGYYTGSR